MPVARTRTSSSVQINGPALRAIRERTGVSCSALARSVGADGSFLARVEKGEKRGVRRETYDRLAAALHIDGRAILVNPYGEDVRQDTVANVEPLAIDGLQCSSTTRKAA